MDSTIASAQGGSHPDHVSISEFRRVHLDALGGLFLQVLKLCQLGALALQVDPYIATGRIKHGAALPAKRRALPRTMPVKDWMRARLESEEGEAIYRRRKAIVEPVFGKIEHARGFRAFGLRGLRKVRGEFSLVATAHNLRKLHRCQSAPFTPS